jgi:hypothetical protein
MESKVKGSVMGARTFYLAGVRFVCSFEPLGRRERVLFVGASAGRTDGLEVVPLGGERGTEGVPGAPLVVRAQLRRGRPVDGTHELA